MQMRRVPRVDPFPGDTSRGSVVGQWWPQSPSEDMENRDLSMEEVGSESISGSLATLVILVATAETHFSLKRPDV